MQASLVGEDELQPGEETKIQVSLSTAGRGGPIAKAALVETDHPRYTQVHLKIEANVLVDLDFASTAIRFTDIAPGASEVQTIDFTADDPAKVKFGPVKVAGEGVSAKMVKTGAGDAAKWALVVTFKPAMPGPLSGTIEVPLVEPEAKDLRIFYSAQVKGIIDVRPVQLMMRRGAADEKTTGKVELVSEKKFTVKGVTPLENLVSAEVQTVTEGTHYAIVITLTDKAAAQDRFGTTVKVETSIASQAVIDIPIYVATSPTP